MKYFYPEYNVMTNLFEYRGKIIHFNDQGGGQVICLIHGYLETSEIWDGFAGKLAEKYRVIVPDLPGHGKSDLYSEVQSMDQAAEIIKALLDYLAIDKIFLVGHSMGGYIALAFTEMFPEKLTGYSLFHSHPFADTPEILIKRGKEIKLVDAGLRDTFCQDNITGMYATINTGKFGESLQRSKRIAESVSSAGIKAVLRGMMKRPSRLNVMENGNIPCLWILGERDNYINCNEIQTRVRLPHNSVLTILPGSGHMGFIEEEEKSMEAIESFLSNILRL